MTSKFPVGNISVVTLIRTDTTLDHSQKAEKVWGHIRRCAGVPRALCKAGVHKFAVLHSVGYGCACRQGRRARDKSHPLCRRQALYVRRMLVDARKQSTSREILLWMTPSEAPKALQASECSELLDPMRASCWISAQH